MGIAVMPFPPRPRWRSPPDRVARGVFVTGTGTGVGKTVVAAAVARRLARAGTVAVFKPAVTGLDEPGARPTRVAAPRRRLPQSDEEIAPYR